MKKLLSVLSLVVLSMVSCEDNTTAEKDMDNTSQTLMKNAIEAIPENWKNKEGKVLTNASKDFVRTSNGKVEASTLEEYENAMAGFKAAFPDCRVTINHIETKNQTAYVTWNFSGTNTGEFLGKPATGKPISVEGFSIWTFNDKEETIREDAFFDWMDLMTQLGYTFSYPTES